MPEMENYQSQPLTIATGHWLNCHRSKKKTTNLILQYSNITIYRQTLVRPLSKSINLFYSKWPMRKPTSFAVRGRNDRSFAKPPKNICTVTFCWCQGTMFFQIPLRLGLLFAPGRGDLYHLQTSCSRRKETPTSLLGDLRFMDIYGSIKMLDLQTDSATLQQYWLLDSSMVHITPLAFMRPKWEKLLRIAWIYGLSDYQLIDVWEFWTSKRHHHQLLCSATTWRFPGG